MFSVSVHPCYMLYALFTLIYSSMFHKANFLRLYSIRNLQVTLMQKYHIVPYLLFSPVTSPLQGNKLYLSIITFRNMQYFIKQKKYAYQNNQNEISLLFKDFFLAGVELYHNLLMEKAHVIISVASKRTYLIK